MIGRRRAQSAVKELASLNDEYLVETLRKWHQTFPFGWVTLEPCAGSTDLCMKNKGDVLLPLLTHAVSVCWFSTFSPLAGGNILSLCIKSKREKAGYWVKIADSTRVTESESMTLWLCNISSACICVIFCHTYAKTISMLLKFKCLSKKNCPRLTNINTSCYLAFLPTFPRPAPFCCLAGALLLWIVRLSPFSPVGDGDGWRSSAFLVKWKSSLARFGNSWCRQ